MATPPQLPLELSVAPFSITEALDLGIPYARLRRADLARPFRGVRSSRAPSSQAELCRAFAPNLRPLHAFCGISAAALWGMWLPRRVSEEPIVDVLALHPARAPRMAGVRAHHAEHATLALVDGMPLTGAAETWCALGAVLELDELVAAGDSLLQRKNPRCSYPELVAAVTSRRGRRGVARAVRALRLLRSGCDSPQETRLRLLLARAGLPEPEVNAIVSRLGERVRFGDLVFVEWHVIVEYDGEHHRTSARQYAEDVARLEQLARAGWTVIRVIKEHF